MKKFREREKKIDRPSPKPEPIIKDLTWDEGRVLPRVQWTGLDMSDAGLSQVGMSLFQMMQHVTVLHLNNNMLVTIPPEISKLTQLSILDASYNRLKVIPASLGSMKKLRELLLFNNQLEQVPFELGQLFLITTLGLLGNPLREPLNSLVNEGTPALQAYLLDHSPIAQEPPQRPLYNFGADISSQHNLKVFCYNVLCDKYATRSLYGYCPSWALDWHYRKHQILREIQNSGADIICLQEVEAGQFDEFFLPNCAKYGYGGIYSVKSRARTMNEIDAKTVDGCAILYQTAKLRLVKDSLIEFERLATSNGNADGSEDMYNRVMPKDNIAIIAVLEYKATKQPVFVSNAHLTWDPQFADVKLIQTMLLLREINSVLQEQRDILGGRDPYIIVCGDFNSLPDSGVVEYLKNGRIGRNHQDFMGGKYDGFKNQDPTPLKHGLMLESAYNGEMPFTNYTHDFTGTIDYIWYSTRSIQCASLLGPVDPAYLSKFDGCPNPHFSSDHISLYAELALM